MRRFSICVISTRTSPDVRVLIIIILRDKWPRRKMRRVFSFLKTSDSLKTRRTMLISCTKKVTKKTRVDHVSPLKWHIRQSNLTHRFPQHNCWAHYRCDGVYYVLQMLNSVVLKADLKCFANGKQCSDNELVVLRVACKCIHTRGNRFGKMFDNNQKKHR